MTSKGAIFTGQIMPSLSLPTTIWSEQGVKHDPLSPLEDNNPHSADHSRNIHPISFCLHLYQLNQILQRHRHRYPDLHPDVGQL